MNNYNQESLIDLQNKLTIATTALKFYAEGKHITESWDWNEYAQDEVYSESSEDGETAQKALRQIGETYENLCF